MSSCDVHHEDVHEGDVQLHAQVEGGGFHYYPNHSAYDYVNGCDFHEVVHEEDGYGHVSGCDFHEGDENHYVYDYESSCDVHYEDVHEGDVQLHAQVEGEGCHYYRIHSVYGYVSGCDFHEDVHEEDENHYVYGYENGCDVHHEDVHEGDVQLHVQVEGGGCHYYRNHSVYGYVSGYDFHEVVHEGDGYGYVSGCDFHEGDERVHVLVKEGGFQFHYLNLHF